MIFGDREMPRVMVRSVLIFAALSLPLSGFASAASVTTSFAVTSNGDNATASVKLMSLGMVVTQIAGNCLPEASAQVSIQSSGTVEDLFIYTSGLPPNTDFDFFVIQVPNAPFGLSWYQGNLVTDDAGNGMQHFRGRFSDETFIVAPGLAPAPVVFNSPPFPDAAQNPPSSPIHAYHLGLWFNSPEDAQRAGCPNTITPFNGEHHDGIQVLNTSNYPDSSGPLRNLHP
jgi:hypothetical protein